MMSIRYTYILRYQHVSSRGTTILLVAVMIIMLYYIPEEMDATRANLARDKWIRRRYLYTCLREKNEFVRGRENLLAPGARVRCIRMKKLGTRSSLDICHSYLSIFSIIFHHSRNFRRRVGEASNVELRGTRFTITSSSRWNANDV